MCTCKDTGVRCSEAMSLCKDTGGVRCLAATCKDTGGVRYSTAMSAATGTRCPLVRGDVCVEGHWCVHCAAAMSACKDICVRCLTAMFACKDTGVR